MHKLDFSDPFDVLPTWYYADSDTPYTAIWGHNVAKTETLYKLDHRCKQTVTPEDGGEPYRCKLGVWSKYPNDGLCFMHHPKVDFRGGAARNAIDRGDAVPKTAHARRRLKLNSTTVKRKKRMGRPPKKKPVVEQIEGDSCWVVFTEHKVLEEGDTIQAQGEVGFANEDLADGFATVLSNTTPLSPLVNQDSLYFYSNVQVKHEKD